MPSGSPALGSPTSREPSADLKAKIQTKLGAAPKQTQPTSEKQEEQLTLDLLLLRLEGGARSGGCLLQLEDDGVLFLTGLPQVLIGHALLDQLLTVYFGTSSMFITLRFGFDYGTNPPLGTLII
jgi:hypothetical protein